jgi:hypothetical protein
MSGRDDCVYLDPVRRRGTRKAAAAGVNDVALMSQTRRRDESVPPFLQYILARSITRSLLTARRAMTFES